MIMIIVTSLFSAGVYADRVALLAFTAALLFAVQQSIDIPC